MTKKVVKTTKNIVKERGKWDAIGKPFKRTPGQVGRESE